MDQELIHIEPVHALDIFTTPGKLEPLLQKVRNEVDRFVQPDITTEAGRAAVRSFAFKVAKSRTYLEGVGKRLADDQKEIPKKIDAARRQARTTLEAWEDEVRKPLTDWEEREKARKERHETAISMIVQCGQPAPHLSSGGIANLIDNVEDALNGVDAQEFKDRYVIARDESLRSLRLALAAAEKREAEQVELARLRKESEAREAAAAAERAKQDAIDAAATEAKRLEEQERFAAAAAQRAADETEARIRREAAAHAAAEEAEAQRRAENVRHAGAINRKAVEALVNGGIEESIARAVITLIAKKAVPAVTITY